MMRFLTAAAFGLMLMVPAFAADTVPAAPPPAPSQATPAPAPEVAPAPSQATPAPAPEALPAPVIPVLPPPNVTAFVKDHPKCAEISDSCIICKVGEDAVHCSLPGIACIKGDLVCKKDKDAL